MDAWNACLPGAREEQKRVSYPFGTGVRGACEQPSGCWEPKPDTLQEHQLLLLLLPQSPRAWITIMSYHAWQEQQVL